MFKALARRVTLLAMAGLPIAGCAPQRAALHATDLPALRGQPVVLAGTALNAKLGAMLKLDDGVVWLDGVDSWPEGYYQGGDRGRRVQVSGILEERDDLPVFVAKPGEPIMQGMPVPEGTDLQAARRRYVVKAAKWQPLD